MKERGAQIRSPLVEIAHCGLIATDPCPPAPGHVVTSPGGHPVWAELPPLELARWATVGCPWAARG